MTASEWTTLPPNPRDACTCNHPRSTHGEQREGPYCWGVLRTEEPVCECPGFAFKRLTRLEQIRWEHERAAHWDPGFSAITVTGVLLAEVDRLTAEVAHRRRQNRELAAMEEAARDELVGLREWADHEAATKLQYLDRDGQQWLYLGPDASGEPQFQIAPYSLDDGPMGLTELLAEAGPLTPVLAPTTNTPPEEPMALPKPTAERTLVELLTDAAALIRAALEDPELTPPPWLSMDRGDRLVHDPGHDDDAPVYVVDEPMSNGANAEWIALLHPGVGEHLADAFDSVREDAEAEGDLFQPSATGEALIQMARQIMRVEIDRG